VISGIAPFDGGEATASAGFKGFASAVTSAPKRYTGEIHRCAVYRVTGGERPVTGSS